MKSLSSDKAIQRRLRDSGIASGMTLAGAEGSIRRWC